MRKPFLSVVTRPIELDEIVFLNEDRLGYRTGVVYDYFVFNVKMFSIAYYEAGHFVDHKKIRANARDITEAQSELNEMSEQSIWNKS